ncbi:hypothetical protein [Kitasatospora sp. NPDC088783]|uniref:hypothetical protein n=1 Tax=Kitasatospora sp. NPDC088783 TaxID=3364077 RepID=UPI003804B95A
MQQLIQGVGVLAVAAGMYDLLLAVLRRDRAMCWTRLLLTAGGAALACPGIPGLLADAADAATAAVLDALSSVYPDAHTAPPQRQPAPQGLGWAAALLAGCAFVACTVTGARARRRQRRRLEAEHDRVREEYGRFASDPLAVLDRPALADVADPLTAAFLRAMAAAADARHARDPHAYRRAVTALESAWRAADRNAADPAGSRRLR